jgi:hypothetical protein
MATNNSLFNLVETAQKNNTSNKVRLGYTATDYNGVMAALEKAYYEVKRIE